ncbi:MAG: hypothetical protein GVY13_12805 [Alphaproteobacteria bacterium]|jgi:hypothetical protein|nr:hypothetical protein [Alphaproteobacteria bacterium]
MDISEFHADLIASASAKAQSVSIGWHEAFVMEMLERLWEAGEVPEAEVCAEQLTGARSRKLAVDAQAVDDADASLHLFVALPYGKNNPPSLAPAEAREKGFGRLLAFHDHARDGWITQHVEESRPAWSLADLIRRGHYSVVRLHILTDRPLSQRVKSIPDEVLDGGVLATFQVWDLTRLKRIHEASNLRDDLEVDLSGLPGGGLRALKATSGQEDYEAYLAVIPAEHLAAIYLRYGSRLLEGNVRTFLGRRGNVNKGIQKTISEEPARFFAYNNGIAATASAIKANGDEAGGVLITSATDLQIVNGAQTTASLAVALRDRKLPDGGVFVPVKLSVIPPAAAEDLIPQISRYANSQNTVRASDFFANHPFHRQVEGMSRRILAPAVDGSQVQTHWYYERARGQFLNDQAGMTAAQKQQFLNMNPEKQVITKTDLGKVETCFHLEPDTACRGAEKAFVAYAKRITEEWKDERKRAGFSDEWFRAAVARTILFRMTESVVSTADWYEGGYRAQAVAYTCAKLASLASELSSGGRLDYRRVWNLQGGDDVLRQQVYIIAEQMMEVLRSPPREGQNVSEWAKQQACRERALKTSLNVVAGFQDWLVDADIDLAEHKETRATGAIDDDLRRMQAVLRISVTTWSSLRQYARTHKLLLPNDETALRAACRETRNPANEIQSRALWALLARAGEHGWEAPEVIDEPV